MLFPDFGGVGGGAGADRFFREVLPVGVVVDGGEAAGDGEAQRAGVDGELDVLGGVDQLEAGGDPGGGASEVTSCSGVGAALFSDAEDLARFLEGREVGADVVLIGRAQFGSLSADIGTVRRRPSERRAEKTACPQRSRKYHPAGAASGCRLV
jgi:hypothetical protein